MRVREALWLQPAAERWPQRRQGFEAALLGVFRDYLGNACRVELPGHLFYDALNLRQHVRPVKLIASGPNRQHFSKAGDAIAKAVLEPEVRVIHEPQEPDQRIARTVLEEAPVVVVVL